MNLPTIPKKATSGGMIYIGRGSNNHWVEIEIIEEEVPHFHLICPPGCPSAFNEHLQTVWNNQRSFPEFIGIPPLGLPQQLDGLTKKSWQCIPAYQEESIGFEEDECGNLEWYQALQFFEPGLYLCQLDFEVTYGWTLSTPISPSEYEWEFTWYPGGPIIRTCDYKEVRSPRS